MKRTPKTFDVNCDVSDLETLRDKSKKATQDAHWEQDIILLMQPAHNCNTTLPRMSRLLGEIELLKLSRKDT